MLNNLKISDDVQENTADVLGGAKPRTLESGVYPLKVELAYLDVSRGGATALKCVFSTDDGTEVNHTFWLTSGTAKGGNNFYVDSEGNKRLLPGMAAADHLAQITTGDHLHSLTEEEKVANLWSFENKKKVPTKIRAIVELIGKPFLGGIIRKVENKRVQDGSGNWVNGPDKREINELDKAFTVEGLTVAEKLAKNEKPEFIDRWKEKFEGKDIDNYDPSVKGSESSPAVPTAAKETAPLFS